MVKKADIPKHIIDVAMDLAGQGRWMELSLSEIAAAAKLPLSAVYQVYPSKHAIVDGLLRRIDAEVLTKVRPEDAGEPTRDRLFDVLMLRFEALVLYREAVATLLNGLSREPLSALASLPQFGRSMTWMLEAAGLSASGLRGALRRKGLAAIYLATLRVWLNDDSPDLARTMAALDANLRRAEGLVGVLRCRRRTDEARQEASSAAG